MDIPYASPPQGMKYFTVIGPHLDCMDYLVSQTENRRTTTYKFSHLEWNLAGGTTGFSRSFSNLCN